MPYVQKQTGDAWTQDDILRVLADGKGTTGHVKNSKIIYRMLQQMYARQTEMERAVQSTHVDNGVGFNGLDAPWLSDIAERSKNYCDLTPNQATAVGKSLRKYIRQLCDIAGIPYKASKKAKREPKQKELFTEPLAHAERN